MWPPLARRQKAVRAAQARGRGPRHARADGRRRRAECGATMQRPWPPKARPGALRSGPARGSRRPCRRRRASPRPPRGPRQHRGRELEVASRGDFGDDTAVARVQLRLGGYDVRAQPAVVRDETAAVSSHDVSMPRICQAPRPRLLDRVVHDQRVLAVVRVVPAANAAPLGRILVERDGALVGEPDLERVAAVRVAGGQLEARRATGWRCPSVGADRRRPRS